jgi:hypothetical protein
VEKSRVKPATLVASVLMASGLSLAGIAAANEAIDELCRSAWPGGQAPETEDDYVQALKGAKRWKSSAGMPPNFCLQYTLSNLALFLKDKQGYSDAEANRHWNDILSRAGLN